MQSFRKIRRAVAASLLMLSALAIFPNPSFGADKQKFVVVIDAGHGGTDHGAIENGINEKDITLSVAKQLGNLIEKKLKDTEVVYTRSDDRFISLQKRADVANSSKADLFVSIHCNSVDRSNKNRANVVGATTYVLGHHKDNDNLAVAQRENAVVELDADDSVRYSQFDPSSDESHIFFEMAQRKNFQNSIRFAADVQREMAAAGRVSRGVQQAGFWVLWSTAAPAALIELDFLCNPEQAKFLASKEGQEKLAGAIFNAVKNYEKYFRMSLGLASSDSGKNKAPAEQKVVAREEIADENDSPVAEIPASSAVSSSRKHRATTAPAKKPTDGSHRRRSSASRHEGASQVEEVMIAMSEEVAGPSVEMTEESPAPEVKETSKPARRTKEASKPARRSKDKKTSRKGVKQSVNVDYRILLFVSDEELMANDEAFKGVTPVASFRENNKFKYTYGESADRKDMELLLSEISSLFPEARVIKCYY